MTLGAQDCSAHPQGAFTGEVSAFMLKDAGCQYVILGHSERRQGGEDDARVAEKVHQALSNGLKPIVCVGEPLSVHEAGETCAFVQQQLTAILAAQTQSLAGLMVAYEPLWAIGTGHVPSCEHIEAIHSALYTQLKALGHPDPLLLYGGSVTPQNVAMLAAVPHVKGFLVGKACLDPEGFWALTRESRASAQT